MTVAETCWM